MALIPSSDTMKRIYPKFYNSRPHVETSYDDSALTNQSSDSEKNIFLLGSATEGNPNNVYEIKSSASARKIFGSGDLVKAMELIWNPTGDYYQNGGKVYAMRVENATQASLEEGPITITSKVFGASANKIGVSFTRDALSQGYTLRVEYEPQMYAKNYTNIGNIFAIYHGGRQATAKYYGYKVVGNVARANKFILAMGDDSKNMQVVRELDLTKDSFSEVQKLLSAINATPGFQSTILKTCARISTADLDLTPGDDYVIIGTEDEPTTVTSVYGDLKFSTRMDPYISVSINSLGAPTGVQATPTADGATITATPVKKDIQIFANEYLSGGDDGQVPISWADKFKNVHGKNVYYIVPLTAEENVHAELAEFLSEENILGYNYMSFVGGGYNEDFNYAINRQLGLQSNRVALVANSGIYTNLSGKEVHIPAYLMAAYVAGIASSLPIGTPVTHKHLNLVSLDQNFDGDELDQLDANGVIAIENQVRRNASGGFTIVEDVTTYNSTNEPTKNVVSLQEITDFLFDDLRYYLEDNFIGMPVHQITSGLINTFIEAFLKQRVSDGMLASYDGTSIQTVINGNQAYVSFSCAPSRGLRTIYVAGTYTNFVSSAGGNGGSNSDYDGIEGNGINPDTETVDGIIRQNTTGAQTHYVD